MAALAAAVHPSPISPRPPARGTVAPRVRSRLAADAVICLFLASMWLFLWGRGAWNVAEIACGEACPVAVAAVKVFAAAGVTFTLVLVLGVVPLMGRQVHAAGVATDVEAVKAPAPKNFAVRVREELRDPAVIGVLASMAFVLPLIVGVMLKGDSPVKGSRRERMGSVIYYVGVLDMGTVNCLFLCPILTVRIWRAFRMG